MTPSLVAQLLMHLHCLIGTHCLTYVVYGPKLWHFILEKIVFNQYSEDATAPNLPTSTSLKDSVLFGLPFLMPLWSKSSSFHHKVLDSSWFHRFFGHSLPSVPHVLGRGNSNILKCRDGHPHFHIELYFGDYLKSVMKRYFKISFQWKYICIR